MPGPGRARRLYGRFPITSPEPGRPTGCRRGGFPCPPRGPAVGAAPRATDGWLRSAARCCWPVTGGSCSLDWPRRTGNRNPRSARFLLAGVVGPSGAGPAPFGVISSFHKNVSRYTHMLVSINIKPLVTFYSS